MIKVNKYEKTADIITEEGTFQILYSGVHDLHWRYVFNGCILDQPDSKQFTIKKDDEYLYSLIGELYNDIKNYNVFVTNPLDYYTDNTIEELKRVKKANKQLNNSIKEADKYNPARLFTNNSVEWHSDDFSYEEGSLFKIEKIDDSFVVSFEKSKLNDLSLTYSVRLRTSGSRYNYFYMIFMRMYEELMELDNDQDLPLEAKSEEQLVMKKKK